MTDTINGFPIIATWATSSRGGELGGRIIIVDRGAAHEERYVVAWLAEGARSWILSAYCLDLAEASRVFAKRIEREAQR